MKSRLAYAVRVSYSPAWLWIVGPTVVWGLFPLFFAFLPADVRDDLTLGVFGMLMATRALIALACFVPIGGYLYRRLPTDAREALWTFFRRNAVLLVVASVFGVFLVRFFEWLIFRQGQFAFALIFCVALTPFAELFLAWLYRMNMKRSETDSCPSLPGIALNGHHDWPRSIPACGWPCCCRWWPAILSAKKATIC